MPIRHRITGHDEKLPDRLRELRAEKGINKASLAAAVGVSQTCVWNWEKGNTFPQSDALKKLAQTLGTTTDFLSSGIRLAAKTDPAEATAPRLPDVIARARQQVAEAAGVQQAQVKIIIEYSGA